MAFRRRITIDILHIVFLITFQDIGIISFIIPIIKPPTPTLEQAVTVCIMSLNLQGSYCKNLYMKLFHNKYLFHRFHIVPNFQPLGLYFHVLKTLLLCCLYVVYVVWRHSNLWVYGVNRLSKIGNCLMSWIPLNIEYARVFCVNLLYSNIDLDIPNRINICLSLFPCAHFQNVY